jgi:hypothetical protein
MSETHRIGLDEVARHFEELEDPRCTVNRRHPLVRVVVIALMAVLADAEGPTATAKWAALKDEFLWEALDWPNGIPRKDVFRRVLGAAKGRGDPGGLLPQGDPALWFPSAMSPLASSVKNSRKRLAAIAPGAALASAIWTTV